MTVLCLFLAVLHLPCCAQSFSSCVELSRVRSLVVLCGLLLGWSTGSRVRGLQDWLHTSSVVLG